MKINHPVTDHEVLMKNGTILVTRTNLKGVITYANDEFVAISGFSRDELVGKNHNIVRHPDMPTAAFEDLWRCLKAGQPWTAPVKNRTKSGDYYWVEANVTPVYKNGKIDEFLSVRYAPSREQVMQAEAFYQQLNANKAQMRPSGMAAWMKGLKELNMWAKATVAMCAFLLPLVYLSFKLYQEQNWMAMASVWVLAAFAVYLNTSIVKKFLKTISESVEIFNRMSADHFRNNIDLNRGDQIGDFFRAMYSMQVKLNSDLAYSREVGAESMRIKQALDNVQSCVMVANNDLDIIYMNNTILSMFKNAEQDIRQQLPNFDADKLLGANIDQFHKKPEHQRGMLAKLDKTLASGLVIGERHMNIVANPVNNDAGERIGIVVEWLDRTHEVKIEREIASIVESVKVGELSNRIDMTGKQGFFQTLSGGINELSDVIEEVFNEINSTMKDMANGELTHRIESNFEGVYLECKESINSSFEKLSSIVGDINGAAGFINNSSQEIASGNNNLSQRAEQQAASLEQTAASMDELTSTVKTNASNAQEANTLANNARELAEKGSNVVASAVSAMQEINESSNKIADIIGVIDEIAFQTNLLALNASVEAARAGEQGRGFSVVATEVRNLAQRSATAARESKELIQSSVQKVRNGTEFVNETGKALNEIVAGAKKVGDIVAEIAAASSEQSAGIEQVNMAVAQMDEITQQNAALAEEASAASISMSEQSNNMMNKLSFFKVGGVVAAEPAAKNPEHKAVERKPAEAAAPKQRTPQTVKETTNQFEDGENDEWEEF